MCDLVNSTAISESHSPEKMGELLSAFYIEANNNIKPYGGRIIRCMGDAIYAIFDCNHSEQKSAMNAANSALALIQQLSSISTKIDNESLQLSTRISIVSGEGILSYIPITNQETVYGKLPFIADRLKSFANEDEIVVNHNCAEYIRPMFELNCVGTKYLKGLSMPECVWKLSDNRLGCSNHWIPNAQIPRFKATSTAFL